MRSAWGFCCCGWRYLPYTRQAPWTAPGLLWWEGACFIVNNYKLLTTRYTPGTELFIRLTRWTVYAIPNS
jgi:hypothetical protein